MAAQCSADRATVAWFTARFTAYPMDKLENWFLLQYPAVAMKGQAREKTLSNALSF